jgi:hypothetical protein
MDLPSGCLVLHVLIARPVGQLVTHGPCQAKWSVVVWPGRIGRSHCACRAAHMVRPSGHWIKFNPFLFFRVI